MTLHVIQFSGGIGSFCAALRVAELHGTNDMVLLIADTLVEDEDLWRFADDTSRYLGVPLTRVCDGRTPWEVFHHVRFLGNSRFAACTQYLKQIPCREWMESYADPADTVAYIGIENTKRDKARIPAIERNWAPWRVEFPLCAKGEPWLSKDELLDEARAVGIEPPRMYELGYSHNNCGGCCVKAGAGQWAHTLEVFPERFARAEAEEAALRERLGDVSILRQTRQKTTYNLPLSELRKQVSAQDQQALTI
ncbi:hypothetical protein GPA10_22395 [Streptomyces sp. p1417]|uniref:Phosphoadenosine phosphosulphate reductase domain-containing protein n=1 Tax=Streptomyces typhae TaxID=2681492 RepID=A0A6L6X145_9ACTN|nr:hypothetical protein [Streptomyces typhae]MVO87436.1 hypothetical protein [Streptomyces typhae]